MHSRICSRKLSGLKRTHHRGRKTAKSLTGQGHQGIILFSEHAVPNGVKCSGIILESKGRNVFIRFNNDDVIDYFSLRQLQWTKSLNIYKAATMYQALGLTLGIRVNKKDIVRSFPILKSSGGCRQ